MPCGKGVPLSIDNRRTRELGREYVVPQYSWGVSVTSLRGYVLDRPVLDRRR